DGLNFGNTSTAYDRHRPAIARAERRLYDHVVRRFGGGLSGRPLRADARDLIAAARTALDRLAPAGDFHLIATGGLETAADVAAALGAGASLCGWFTGYFEAFSRHGHRLYAELLAELAAA
ncbi:MAG: hypothetical protein D6696_17630, partial [Acidobacteria bacterium]